jgi:hypothetical protein
MRGYNPDDFAIIYMIGEKRHIAYGYRREDLKVEYENLLNTDSGSVIVSWLGEALSDEDWDEKSSKIYHKNLSYNETASSMLFDLVAGSKSMRRVFDSNLNFLPLIIMRDPNGNFMAKLSGVARVETPYLDDHHMKAMEVFKMNLPSLKSFAEERSFSTDSRFMELIDELDWSFNRTQKMMAVTKEMIDENDTDSLLNILVDCYSSKDAARANFESFSIYVDGYNDDPRDLWEIPEVKEYFRNIDARFPYWLFFFDKANPSVLVILECILDFDYMDKKSSVMSLLDSRWLPAMGMACEVARMTNAQTKELHERVSRYFTDGPFSDSASWI